MFCFWGWQIYSLVFISQDILEIDYAMQYRQALYVEHFAALYGVLAIDAKSPVLSITTIIYYLCTCAIIAVCILNTELQNIHSSNKKQWRMTDIVNHTQLGSSERLDSKRKLKESQSSQRSTSVDGQVERLQRQLQEYQLRAQESAEWKRRAEEFDRRAEESDRRAEESDRRAEESDRRAEESDRRAAGLQREVAESVRRAEESDRRNAGLQAELERSAQESNSRIQVVQRSLEQTTRRLRECEDRLRSHDTHWMVRRREIELTGPQLGVGGWATVTVAKFRGAEVAVKRIHNQIVSHHNIQLFQREMNMAARLHHPNLVQFLGATMEGEMMIVMELMSTSLRSQLQKDVYFMPPLVMSISLDVARALTYLHQIQPDAVVHRDISSANVLLEQLPLSKWRAKVTDYGSVNIVRQLNTQNPGSPVYSAPEASNPSLQSPKMDIFSFGALILEMLTGRLPARDDRPVLLDKVFHEQLLDLIERCLSERPEDRPSASAIISELSE